MEKMTSAVKSAYKDLGIVKFPMVELTNNLRVMNFNSPHSFRFTDDTILPAAPDRLAKIGLTKVEHLRYRDGRFDLIQPTFHLNPPLKALLAKAEKAVFRYDIDIIIVPRVLLDVLRAENYNLRITRPNAGQQAEICTIYLADRVEKINCINKFCQ